MSFDGLSPWVWPCSTRKRRATVAEKRERSYSREYLLTATAREVIDISRMARGDEAEELVASALSVLVDSCPVRQSVTKLVAQPKRTISGCMAKAANQDVGTCAVCGDSRRLYRRPNAQLWCADCVMQDFISTKT